MDRRKILVTGVGGDIGQSLVRCLREAHKNDLVIGCDADPYAAGMGELKKFFQCPWVKEKYRYLEFMTRLISRERPDYLFPTTEPEIEFFDRHRDRFARTATGVIINDSGIIRTFMDKYETAEFLKNNNLPYPRTYLLKDFRHGLNFPVILKPKKGCGRKGQFVVTDQKELDFFRKRLSNAVVQEIIGQADEEYTVGVFATGGDIYSIAFKRCLGYGSLTKVAELVQDELIADTAKKIARACALEGILNIQLRKTAKGYVPFEINPRFSSTVYFRHYFGFRDVVWSMYMRENRKIRFNLKYKEGVGVRCLDHVFFNLKKH